MFKRFTEAARQAVVLARAEAVALGHHEVATSHLLLGLLGQDDGIAARALRSLGVTLESTRPRVLQIAPGEDVGTLGAHLTGAIETLDAGQIPFTPFAERVLELALREGVALDHAHIAPEHILLALVRDDEGIAARILRELGTGSTQVRTTLQPMLPPPAGLIQRSRAVRGRCEQRTPAARRWLGSLAPLLDALTVDIRRELGREPDPGDVLLALACMPHTVAGRALNALGVDGDALWAAIEHARLEQAAARRDLARRLRSATPNVERSSAGNPTTPLGCATRSASCANNSAPSRMSRRTRCEKSAAAWVSPLRPAT